MKYAQLYTGIEIETILNEVIHNFTPASYSERKGKKLSKYWSCKRDSSIHAINSNFDLRKDCEFITPILKTRTQFFKAVEDFIKLLSKNGQYELHEVIEINSSCGNHLHLSLSKKYKEFRTKTDYEILKQTRELFFKLLKNSKVLSNETKTSIRSNYFRGYAKELKKFYWDLRHPHTRTLEFNKISERNGLGLEWRSFNLNHVKNWAEFREMFKIGYDCLLFLFRKRTKGYNLKRTRLKFEKAKLKREFKEKDKDTILNINLNDENETKTIQLNQEDSLRDLSPNRHHYEDEDVDEDEDREYIYDDDGDEIGYYDSFGNRVYYD